MWFRVLTKKKKTFVLGLLLSTLMSLNNIFIYTAAITNISSLWYPFILFNSLQSVFIFVFYNLNYRVYYSAYEKIFGRPHPKRQFDSCVLTEKEKIPTSILTTKCSRPKKIKKVYERQFSKELQQYSPWQQLDIFQKSLLEQNNREGRSFKRCKFY